MSKKVLLSGIQPSGKPHIGNYFGMIKQLLGQQDEYEVYALIVDYHAMKSVQNPKEMRENIKNVVLDYLALGLDPKKVTFFKQSDVSEHTELCWIFDTITTMQYLMRAHAFKDEEAKNKEIDVVTFNYPMIMKEVAIIPGTDGQKMSKSYNNTIPLFAEYEEIKKAVMSIVTDSRGGVPQNVFAIHKLFRNENELNKIYAEKAGKYKELKELLVEDLEKFIAPLREKRKEFAKDIPKALAILKAGGEKAKKVASAKMDEVREKIGVSVY